MLKLPDVWRLMREVDLEAIRADSERSFRAQLAAEDPADAETAAILLTAAAGEGTRGSPPARSCPPWSLPAALGAKAKQLGSGRKK